MKGLENLFAEEFDREAKNRGFIAKENSPKHFGQTPIYGNDHWLVFGAVSNTFSEDGVPECIATIAFTPLNTREKRAAADGETRLLRGKALWLPEEEKWDFNNSTYTNSELISYAFDHLDKVADSGSDT